MLTKMHPQVDGARRTAAQKRISTVRGGEKKELDGQADSFGSIFDKSFAAGRHCVQSTSLYVCCSELQKLTLYCFDAHRYHAINTPTSSGRGNQLRGKHPMPCIKEDKDQKSALDFCDLVELVNTTSTPYLLHSLFVPALIIVLLTLMDRCREDAKWFMFNTAVINIATGIAWEMKRIPISFGAFNSYINFTWYIGRDLSQYSVFLLAASRIFCLYWEDLYKKLFAGKRLFVWIIACDALLAALSHWTHGFGTTLGGLYMGMEIFMLLGTFGCSLLVLLKIRNLAVLVGLNTQTQRINDLRTAAFICIFQAFFYAIYTILLIYMRLYDMQIIITEPSSPVILRILLRVFSELQNPMFLLFTILDTLIPMILLKSYRKTISKLFLKSCHIFFRQKSTIVISAHAIT
ncbi:hypothetical protein DdX_17466 [Ditylenchus destructor]|uniref:Uncharacterized protein n=1 Tax=Ditylenchus destructor TaxID=166010 RepID=A0AAD4MNG4_9BILA|nr:hypothetical protein DdX_17466 [Ditylenchus destructor]